MRRDHEEPGTGLKAAHQHRHARHREIIAHKGAFKRDGDRGAVRRGAQQAGIARHGIHHHQCISLRDVGDAEHSGSGRHRRLARTGLLIPSRWGRDQRHGHQRLREGIDRRAARALGDGRAGRVERRRLEKERRGRERGEEEWHGRERLGIREADARRFALVGDHLAVLENPERDVACPRWHIAHEDDRAPLAGDLPGLAAVFDQCDIDASAHSPLDLHGTATQRDGGLGGFPVGLD